MKVKTLKNKYGIHKDSNGNISIGYNLDWGISSQLDINIPMEDVEQIIYLLNREKSDIPDCGKVDKKLLIELIDEHAEAFCKSSENKNYNIISGRQLVNIISDYMKRSKRGNDQLKDAISYLKTSVLLNCENRGGTPSPEWIKEVRRFIDEVEAGK